MRTKGLLVWNTLSQCMGAYVTWVDAIALDKIGASFAGCLPVQIAYASNFYRLQILWCLHAVGSHPMGSILQV